MDFTHCDSLKVTIGESLPARDCRNADGLHPPCAASSGSTCNQSSIGKDDRLFPYDEAVEAIRPEFDLNE